MKIYVVKKTYKIKNIVYFSKISFIFAFLTFKECYLAQHIRQNEDFIILKFHFANH